MRKIAAVLFFFLVTNSAFAQEQCGSIVHRVLEVYGGLDTLRSYPEQLLRQINGQLKRDQSMTEEQKAKLSHGIAQSISVDRLINGVETRLSTGCNPAEMEGLLKEMQAPLVQKMRGLEASAQTAEGSAKLDENLATIDKEPPSENRKRLIRELMDATDTTDITVSAILATTRGVVEGMGMPPADEEQVARMRQRIRDSTDAQMNRLMLAVYRDATDEELQRYVAFQQKPEFRKFNQQFSSAMIAGIGAEALSAGTTMRALLNEIKTPPAQPPARPPNT
jgi:hypothetical protein